MGLRGEIDQLKNSQPKGLTPEKLEAYKVWLERQVDAIIDPMYLQAKEALQEALDKLNEIAG